MTAKSLRLAGADERRSKPATLLEAVESGDVLDMLLAQRRLIAEALTSAGESTRPQLNNELNKLHTLIAAEQERRATAEHQEADDGNLADVQFSSASV